ncbi:hypothetical protein ACQY0O_005048 [Thecaphora frezii]
MGNNTRVVGRPWTKSEIIYLFHMAYERKTIGFKDAAAHLDRTEKSCQNKVVALHKVVDELIGSWAKEEATGVEEKVGAAKDGAAKGKKRARKSESSNKDAAEQAEEEHIKEEPRDEQDIKEEGNSERKAEGSVKEEEK